MLQIESTEYIDDLFELKSKYGMPMLTKFAELVNKEMFWVVTEVCTEHNPLRRMRIVKQFIKVASELIRLFKNIVHYKITQILVSYTVVLIFN